MRSRAFVSNRHRACRFVRLTVALRSRPMTATRIRLAFSPDSDDIFMFWALLSGKVDTEGLDFVAERADTETLNARAERGDVDVIAVSIARYASIADRYMLLPHGMSV